MEVAKKVKQTIPWESMWSIESHLKRLLWELTWTCSVGIFQQHLARGDFFLRIYPF